ncbi:MAG TPA: response regulator receiver protein, partial [Halomonas sp.]|nr:response regulator receiver protein [Halomonas sp.]
MVNRDQQSLEHKLALLKQTYQQNLQTELASLCSVLTRLQQTLRAQLMTPVGEALDDEAQAPRETLTDVYRRLHKLAGSAG